MQSLRRTLAVRFSITMFLALLVIAVWAFIGTHRVLYQELDRGLVAAAHLESAALTAGYPIPHLPDLDDRAAFVATVNRFVVARQASGAVIAANTPLAADLPFDSTGLRRAADGNANWTTLTWGGDEFRVYYLPILRPTGSGARVVQVAASLGPIDDASRDVLFLLFGTVLLGMLATILGATWLAGSAVAPVSEIAEQAEAIGPDETQRRITAHASVSEFNGLVRVLNGMLDRLEQGVLAQRRIIADVGHDLRTPITAMQGEIEVVLRHQRDPERYAAALKSILEEVNQLGTLSDTLITLARIEAGELRPEPRPTSVSELVDNAARRYRPRAGDRTIDVETSDDRDSVVDKGLIDLALDQLLDNAIRHTPDGIPIAVRVAASDGQVTIVVEDRGPGVPDDVLPHLFERFYRGDAARGRGGAGLGLTVAASIIHAHGGRVHAERADPSGLRLVIAIPRGSAT